MLGHPTTVPLLCDCTRSAAQQLVRYTGQSQWLCWATARQRALLRRHRCGSTHSACIRRSHSCSEAPYLMRRRCSRSSSDGRRTCPRPPAWLRTPRVRRSPHARRACSCCEATPWRWQATPRLLGHAGRRCCPRPMLRTRTRRQRLPPMARPLLRNARGLCARSRRAAVWGVRCSRRALLWMLLSHAPTSSARLTSARVSSQGRQGSSHPP